jgi:hypothetical protein
MFVHTDIFNYKCSILTNTARGQKGKAIPIKTWTGHEFSRRLRLPEYLDNWHIKVVKLTAVRISRLKSHEILRALISVRGCVDPRAVFRPEELSP